MVGDPEVIYFDGLSPMRASAAAAESIVAALPGERRSRQMRPRQRRFRSNSGNRTDRSRSAMRDCGVPCGAQLPNFRIPRNPGPILLPRSRKVQPFDNLCPRLPEIGWVHTKSSAHWAPAVWAKCIKPALARVGDDPGGRPNRGQGRGPGRRSAVTARQLSRSRYCFTKSQPTSAM